jgi:WD40 repeat protein
MMQMTFKMRLLLSTAMICFSAHAAARSEMNPSWQEKIQIKLPASARSLAYAGDGLTLAVGHANGQISICDTKTGSLREILNTTNDPIEALLFTPSGDRLISITKNNKMRIWSVTDWKQVATFDGITPVSKLSPDGHWLVTQNPKHAIVLWDLVAMKRSKQLGETGLDGATNINFTSDGKRIALSYQHKVNLIDIDSGKITELPVRGRPQGMKVQQTGKDTFAISLGALDDDSAIVHRVIASSSDSLLAVGRGWYGKPNFVDVWNYSTGTLIGRFKPKDDGALAQFSFDNSLLAVGGANSVTIWNIANGQQTGSLHASLVYEDTPLAKGSTLFLFSPIANELALIDDMNLRIYAAK